MDRQAGGGGGGGGKEEAKKSGIRFCTTVKLWCHDV